MQWRGTWKNQYGSTLRITHESDGRIAGTFVTALRDSTFYGHESVVVGMHQDECISFSFGRSAPSGAAIASFTGRLENGKLETLWYVVSGQKPWPHAVMSNADTFERVSGE